MFKTLSLLVLTLVSLLCLTSNAEASADIRLQATMRGAARVKAVATYEERPRGNLTEQRFKVQVEGMPKNSTHIVSHNGIVLGIVTVNQFGRGALDLRVNSDNPGNVPSLPHVVAGDSVTVGALSGTFVNN